MIRSLLLVSLVLAAGLSAQGYAVYVPDNQPGVGNCNVIPWGTSVTSPTWVNQRYQQVVTMQDLNSTPGVVTGLSFAPCGSGTHRSSSLQITLAIVPAGFDLAVNRNFDDNLNVVGTNATVVLSQTDHSWDLVQDNWSSVGLDSFFVYTGGGDLLVDIITIGNDNSVTSAGMRRDQRGRLYAHTWTGIPPATGTYGSIAALRIGVEFGCANLSTYGSGCDGATLSLSGSAALGSTVNAELTNGGPGLPCVLNVGTLNTTPFPIELAALGFPGCRLYTGAEASAGGVANQAGGFTASFGVPNLPALIGVRVFSQFLAIKSSAPGGGVASNAGRILFGSGC